MDDVAEVSHSEEPLESDAEAAVIITSENDAIASPDSSRSSTVRDLYACDYLKKYDRRFHFGVIASSSDILNQSQCCRLLIVTHFCPMHNRCCIF